MLVGAAARWLSLRSLLGNCLFLSLLCFLTACSERNIEIGFLSKGSQGKAELTVDNAVAGSDMLPNASETLVPMEITCSKNVNMLEVQNSQTKEWKKVPELIAGATFDCASDGKVSFQVPLDYVAPYSPPTAPGDRRQDFQIRWSVKNLEGETLVYYRTLSVLFKAPLVTTTAPNINIEVQSSGYIVTGTCSESGGIVFLQGPFSSDASVSCNGGAYSAHPELSIASVTKATVRVQHRKTATSRTYAEVEKIIAVDTEAPVLSFTTPVENEVFNSLKVGPGGSIHVVGHCSESMLPVKIFVSGVQITEALCSVALGFEADVVVAEGVSAIKAQQTDAAGNLGESADYFFEKRTTPPGPFSVLGVRSQGGEDSAVDNLLTAKGLRVDLGASVGAVTYEAFVKDNAGTTTICGTQSSNVNNINFSCPLQQNTTYRIYAQAKDVYGNSIVANNSGYTFTTQFPVPKITRIYTDSGNTIIYKAGMSLSIYVEFDKAIGISGGDPVIALNTSEIVNGAQIVGNKIKYTYVVGADVYTQMLVVNSIGLNGASIYDAIDNTLAADISVPVDTGATGNFLGSQRIKIDSKNPNPVISLTLGSTPTKFFQSPTISFVLPTDPDPLVSSVRIVRASDGVVVAPWGSVSSGLYLNMSGAAMGTLYTVEVRLFDPAGNVSTIVSKQFTSLSCPANFAYIYDSVTDSAPFCVAQFEAKESALSPKFSSVGVPVSASQMTAIQGCSNLGSGYQLISNQEWNIIAELIRKDSRNWTGGAVGSGILHRGNTAQSLVPEEVNLGNACAPDDNGLCLTGGYRRLSYLPYNEGIWDFAGNAWEVVYEPDSLVGNSGYVVALESSDPIRLKYGTQSTCESPAFPDYCGFGRIDFSQAGPIIWRGGGAGEGNSSGVFATKRASDANAAISKGGFRCVYHP